MRKNETQEIKSVIREYIEALGHHKKLKEVNITSSWEKLMGKMIANRTKSVFIKNKVLFVKLDSSVLRSELLMQRDSIIRHINDHAGEVIIEKVVLQ